MNKIHQLLEKENMDKSHKDQIIQIQIGKITRTHKNNFLKIKKINQKNKKMKNVLIKPNKLTFLIPKITTTATIMTTVTITSSTN